MKQFLYLTFLSLIFSATAYADNLVIHETTVIPLKSIVGYPAIEVNIQGKNFPLLIDTGAGTGILLEEKAAKTLKLIIHNETTTFSTTCGNKVTYQAFTLPSLNIANLNTKNINGYLYNLPPGCTISIPDNQDKTNKSEEADDPRPFASGMLGTEFFLNTQVIFDFPHNKLIFFNKTIPQNYANLKWQWFDFKLKDNREIIVTTTIQNKKLNLVIDTGGGNTMLNPSLNLKPNQSSCPSFSIDSPSCKELSLTDFKIGSANLGNINFAIFNEIDPKKQVMPFDGVIGTALFRSHIVLIDFRNLKIGVVK